MRTGPTKAGNPLYWESGCIFLTVDSDGTKEIPGDRRVPGRRHVHRDVERRHRELLVLEGRSTTARKSVEVNGKDYTNVLKFRDASWCRPATKDAPAKCYSDSSAGITTATFVDDGGMRDGAIVDADIEINGVNFSISVDGVTLGVVGCNAELANTLTHELGHLHGLEHTCLASGDPPRVDGNGNPVPECQSTTDPTITEATMYPFQDCGETKKETLEADDIAAICTIYPTANDPHSCAPVDASSPGCCSVGGDNRTPVGPLALTALVGWVGFAQNSTPAVAQVSLFRWFGHEWRGLSRLRGRSRAGLRQMPEVPSAVAALRAQFDLAGRRHRRRPRRPKSWPIIAIVIGVVVVVFIGWQVKKAFDDYRTKVHHVRDAGVLTDEPANTPAPNSINDSRRRRSTDPTAGERRCRPSTPRTSRGRSSTTSRSNGCGRR